MVVAAVGSVCALLGGAIWAGSRRGRSWVQGMIQPVCDKVGREDPEVSELEFALGGVYVKFVSICVCSCVFVCLYVCSYVCAEAHLEGA